MSGRQKLILVLLLGAQFMLAVDFSILNVAIPKIGAGLGFLVQDLQWITTAFALTAAGFTLLFGRIADLYGRRKLFLTGVALLGVASLTGGLAGTPAILLAARAAQGLGMAIATPAALSLLTTSFSEGPLRARALGLNGALLSAGFALGGLLGGAFTDLLSWRWAFFINVPVCAVILVVAPLVLTSSRTDGVTRFDVPGAVTVTAGLLALVFGITSGGREGWANVTTLGSLAIALVLLTTFWFIEANSTAPLASVRLLARRTVSWGNFGGFVTFTMETSLVFLMTLYLQGVLGYSALSTGLVFGILGVVAFFAGIYAGKIIEWAGNSRTTLMAGLGVQGLASVVLVLVGSSRSSIIVVIVATAIGGFAHVLAVVSYMVTATSGLPDHEQGLATGLTTLTQQVSITLGVPVLSTVAATRFAATGPTLAGIRLGMITNAGFLLFGSLLIALFFRPSGRHREVVPSEPQSVPASR